MLSEEPGEAVPVASPVGSDFSCPLHEIGKGPATSAVRIAP